MSRLQRPRVITIYTIQERILEAITDGYFRFFLIVGDKGTGKSSLLMKTLKQIFSIKTPDEEKAWKMAFHHLTFTPQQFYRIYQNQKREIDWQLRHMGLPAWVLSADIEQDWPEIIDAVLGLNIGDFEPIRRKYRIPAMGIDDMGAHLSRHDTTIYWDPYYQHLFADLTLIRPYLACILATAPDIEDCPRTILKHVTDIILAEEKGEGTYRIKKRFVRFQGRTVGGFSKLYDQTPVKWNPLPKNKYAKYEILRHLLSRKVSNEAEELAQAKKMEQQSQFEEEEIDI